MTEQSFREHIVATARSWLGTPFKKYGRSRQYGVDCGGVIICVGREVGAFHFEWNAAQAEYETAINVGLWGPWPGCSEIAWEDLAPGDIAMGSHYAKPSVPSRVGIVAEQNGELTVIHYERRESCVIEEPLIILMDGRVTKAHRFRFPPEAARDDL